MICVAYLSMDSITEAQLLEMRQWLPPAFQKRVRGQKITQKHSLVGRFLLYHHLVLNTKGFRHRQAQFILKQHGKLHLQQGPDFNISHCKSYVAIAINNSKQPMQIGLDIEKIRTLHQLSDLLQYFTTNEKKHILNSQHPSHLFLKFWTKKEAYFKAIGKGIHHKNSLRTLDCLSDQLKHKKWHFYDLNIDKNYTATCVVNHKTTLDCSAKNVQELLFQLKNLKVLRHEKYT